MKKLVKIGMASVLSFIALSAIVFAAPIDLKTEVKELDLFKETTRILTAVQNWATGIIGVIAIIVLLYAAFLYMTAGGDEDKMKSAHAYIKYGIIGIAVAIFAYSAMAIVKTTLGV